MNTFQLILVAVAVLLLCGPYAKGVLAKLPAMLRKTAADKILAPVDSETDYVTVEQVMRIACWAKDRGMDDVAAALTEIPARCFVCPEVAREVAP